MSYQYQRNQLPSRHPPPILKSSTKKEIETYFAHHFNKNRVYTSPEDTKHPTLIPDYHISGIKVAKILGNLSPEALEFFENEYLDDIYVFLNSPDEFLLFAPIALRYPSINGRIKLDSRNSFGGFIRAISTDSTEEEKEKRGQLGRGLYVWKTRVATILDLIREEFLLTKEGFKVRCRFVVLRD